MATGVSVRRTGSCLCVRGHCLYRWRGDDTFDRTPPLDEVEIFDFSTGQWSTRVTTGSTGKDDIPLAITGASMGGIAEKLYLYGGYGPIDRETYYRHLHELDLSTFKWKKIIPLNDDQDGPMEKYLCGMVALEDGRPLLLIFGGFGRIRPENCRQKSAQYKWSSEFSAYWTNELHAYDVTESKWVNMETSGTKPPPCAAGSFTRIDKSRILLFGGRQHARRVNEIHILDIRQWHWSGAIVQSSPEEPWPEVRSLHTAVCLVDPVHVSTDIDDVYPLLTKQRLLVIWGQGANGAPITDTWILDTENMTWKRYDNLLHDQPSNGRKWHSSCAYHPSPHETIAVTYGGFKKEETVLSRMLDGNVYILKVGVTSLYQLCLACIGSSDGFMESLLPKHMQQHVKETMEATARFNSHFILDYSSKFCN